jgi:hypothetical protein
VIVITKFACVVGMSENGNQIFPLLQNPSITVVIFMSIQIVAWWR